MSLFENSAKAFNTALHDFGSSNGIPVALENISFDTDISIPFLAGFQLDVDVTSADLNVNEAVSFIYQIDYRFPSHKGSASLNKIMDLLRARFPIGSYHTWDTDCFGVDDLTVSSLRVDDGWGVKSISLTVSGFTPRLV